MWPKYAARTVMILSLIALHFYKCSSDFDKGIVLATKCIILLMYNFYLTCDSLKLALQKLVAILIKPIIFLGIVLFYVTCFDLGKKYSEETKQSHTFHLDENL